MSGTGRRSLETVPLTQFRPEDRIIHQLGVGNGGEVFKATISGITCAIKVYTKLKKFETELAAYLAIAHVPQLRGRICGFHGLLASVQKLFPQKSYLEFGLLLTYLPGPTLEDKIMELSPSERVNIQAQLTKTMQLLYKEAGVAHRSMYGRNIIILDDGKYDDGKCRYRAVLLDFTSAGLRYLPPPVLLDPLSGHLQVQRERHPPCTVRSIPTIGKVSVDLVRLQLRYAYLHYIKAYLEAFERKDEGEDNGEYMMGLAKTAKVLYQEVYTELHSPPFARLELAATQVERKVIEQITLDLMHNGELPKSTDEELQIKKGELKKKCEEQQAKYEEWKRILRETHALIEQAEIQTNKIGESVQILESELEEAKKKVKEDVILKENAKVDGPDDSQGAQTLRGEKASDLTSQSQDAKKTVEGVKGGSLASEKLALATDQLLEVQRTKIDLAAILKATHSVKTDNSGPEIEHEFIRKLQRLIDFKGPGLVSKAQDTMMDAMTAIDGARACQDDRWLLALIAQKHCRKYYDLLENSKTETQVNLAISRNTDAVDGQQLR